MVGEDVELVAHHQPAEVMSPYERLLTDAMEGDTELFSRQDIIETLVADRRPRPRRRHARASLRPGLVGARGGRPPDRGRRRLARPERPRLTRPAHAVTPPLTSVAVRPEKAHHPRIAPGSTARGRATMGQFDSVMNNPQSRRTFLRSMAVMGGMGVLAACRRTSSPAAPARTPPPPAIPGSRPRTGSSGSTRGGIRREVALARLREGGLPRPEVQLPHEHRGCDRQDGRRVLLGPDTPRSATSRTTSTWARSSRGTPR